MSELAEHASNHELMAFGTSTRWKVSPECFTERGRQYLQFIQETVESERQRALQLSSSYDDFQINQLKIKGSIPLFSRYLDDFFELQEPWKLEFIVKEDGKKKADFLTLTHKNPRLSFTLEKSEDDKGFFQGV